MEEESTVKKYCISGRTVLISSVDTSTVGARGVSNFGLKQTESYLTSSQQYLKKTSLVAVTVQHLAVGLT